MVSSRSKGSFAHHGLHRARDDQPGADGLLSDPDALPADGLPKEIAEAVDGPPEAMRKLEDGSKFLELSMGPQHPSTHGVLRLAVRLDGEEVVECKVDIGYLHRSFEKFAETWQFPQLAPFVDRNDYLAGTLNEHAYCLAVERLLDLEVPERAEYIRVIMAELNRIGSHLIWFGTFAMDLGATTAFLWAFEGRERIYDLNEVVTGGRMFPQFFRLGGVRNDFPQEFFPMVEKTLAEIEASLEKFHGLVTGNPIFEARTKGIGRLSAEEAIAFGCSGAVLRATGVPYDVRKADPYSIYDRFEFDVPVGENGDVYDRYIVRMREMEESIKIVRQALKEYPRKGPIMGKLPRRLKPPRGAEVYAHVESPRGDLGVYIVSDGTDQPYRLKWRAPSFSNLYAVQRLAPGLMVADLVALVGSVDIVLGEVDR